MRGDGTRYRLAIFDLDGTLCDSLPWFVTVLPTVAARHGFRVPADAAEQELLRTLGPRELLHRLGVPRWRVPLIARDLRRRKAASLRDIPLFPGVHGLLHALADAGVVLALATSDIEANARGMLGRESAALIRFWGCGAPLFGKARLLRRMLRQSGVSPGAAILIGDEVRDAEAARAAGVAFGAVSWGFNAPAALLGAAPAAVLFGQVDDIAAHVLGVEAAPPAVRPAA
jgi:phosphoglycolate phosphatase